MKCPKFELMVPELKEYVIDTMQCLQIGPYFRHWSLIGTFWGKSENLVHVWSLFYKYGPYFLKNWRNKLDLGGLKLMFV